ncbi:MAG: hypothetical protein AAF649_05820 [Verrucomicrobiota bacterium]
MDLGDLIIPILIIGSVIVQWLSSSKKEDREQGSPPDPTALDRPEPAKTRNDPSWDDLMEALGQPAAPPELPAEELHPPVPLAPDPAPPPVPVNREPEPPVVSLFDRQKEKLAEKQRQLELLKQKTKVQLPASKRTSSAAAGPPGQGMADVLNIRGMLDNRKSLKQAIVVNEILQPPVSLR